MNTMTNKQNADMFDITYITIEEGSDAEPSRAVNAARGSHLDALATIKAKAVEFIQRAKSLDADFTVYAKIGDVMGIHDNRLYQMLARELQIPEMEALLNLCDARNRMRQ